jgi:uncharacterized protein YecT (DUF1311 family)
MHADHPVDPWSGTTYKGFAGGQATAPSPRARRSTGRPRSARGILLGAVAAVLGLGLAAGMLMAPQLGLRPQLSALAPPTPPPAATPAARPVAPAVPSVAPAVPSAAPAVPAVEPAAPAAAPAASPAAEEAPITATPEPLVPRPRTAQRPEARRPSITPEARRQASAATARANLAAAASPETSLSPPSPIAPSQAQPPQAAAPTPPPGPAPQASFDCATARPGAEQAVCSDPTLAAADRRLARAYRHALAAGVDPESLRREQSDWLAIREDAARRSPTALSRVYAQRINELEDMAVETPPPYGGQ